jgi:hypothetical protein
MNLLKISPKALKVTP